MANALFFEGDHTGIEKMEFNMLKFHVHRFTKSQARNN